MALKFSMMLEAVDRVSAPAKRIKSNFSGLVAGARAWGQQVRKVSRDIDSGARSLEFYQTRARRLRQVALGSFFRAARMQARQFAGSLRSGIRNLHLMERAGRAAKSGLGWLGGKAMGLAKWGVAAGVAAGGFALFDLFRTAGQFEQYQVMLEVMEGSAAKAKKSMAWIQKFAQTTPFELDGVTKAFTVLKNAGLDPTNGLLRATGDAAAGMSSDIVEAALALADASNGQFERLIDLGITASSQGNKVRLNWVKNGKQIEKVADKADKVGLAMAVAAAWSDKFAGSSDRQSKTLFGIINNIKDKWNGFLMMVANAGIFDVVKNDLDDLLAHTDKLAKDGTLKQWAEDISSAMQDMWKWAVKFYKDTDWEKVGQDVRTIATALADSASALASLVRLSQKINPFTGGLLGDWLRTGNNQKSDAKPAQPGRGRAPSRRTRAPSSEPRLPAPGRGNWKRLPSADRKPQASASRLDVGGSTKIEVAFKGPLTGRVRSINANNPSVPLVVNTGRTMDHIGKLGWPA